MSDSSAFADRAFVLGLDGVPWDKLGEWVAAGHLPAFQRLFEEGASGPLESTTPATTALAWPSIYTGAWPDRHGVYAFQRLAADYTHEMYTGSDVAGPTLWDVLTPAVVGNVPMTYPARELDGQLVAGMLTPDTDADGFTYPEGLADDLDEAIPDYRIELDWNEYTARQEAFVEDLSAMLASRHELLEHLMAVEDWRLFFFVFTEPDRFQHLKWEEEALLDHYRQLDDVLDDVLTYVSERDATLYVVSDHGFGPVKKHVHLNTVLEEAGYLSRQEDDGTRWLLGRLGLTRDRVQDVLHRVGVDDRTLVDTLPRSLVDRVASGVPGSHALFDVDHSASTVFAHDEGEVYVNDTERFDEGTVPPSEVADVKAEVRSLLADVTDPETGESVLTVHDGDDLFPRDPRSPDLVVDSDTYVPKASLADSPIQPTGGLAANHRKTGIFLAWGPNVDAGATVEGASVVDVAPTLLHSVGEAVPEAVDGEVLREVFAPGSAPAARDPETREQAHVATDQGAAPDGDFEAVEDRLRGLGYME